MVWSALIEDIDAMIARDPAARSRLEIVFLYPAFHAVMGYRFANALYRRRWFFLARLLSQTARFLTGIEIHPGATIGRRFFIDHGMGVVIGETARIGDDVTLYHDVTLGGVSPAEESDAQRCVKRHPTLADGVIVGSGAQVLGPIEVGANARVGANAVVVSDVAAGVTVVGVPAKVVLPKTEADAAFSPYGTPVGDIPDPVARALDGLLAQVTELKGRVGQLEEELESERARAARVAPGYDRTSGEGREPLSKN